MRFLKCTSYYDGQPLLINTEEIQSVEYYTPSVIHWTLPGDTGVHISRERYDRAGAQIVMGGMLPHERGSSYVVRETVDQLMARLEGYYSI